MANAFFTLTVPAGSGIGAVTDISTLQRLRTILCIGEVSGTLFVEVAMVNISNAFVPVAIFDGANNAGRVSHLNGRYAFARVRRVGARSDQPVVTLGGEAA